jgi:hypothetical protein
MSADEEKEEFLDIVTDTFMNAPLESPSSSTRRSHKGPYRTSDAAEGEDVMVLDSYGEPMDADDIVNLLNTYSQLAVADLSALIPSATTAISCGRQSGCETPQSCLQEGPRCVPPARKTLSAERNDTLDEIARRFEGYHRYDSFLAPQIVELVRKLKSPSPEGGHK